MNTTPPQPPAPNDDSIKTQGVTGNAIFSVLSKLVSSPSVLTFDGNPYDDSLATHEYAFMLLDGENYGYVEQPDQTTTWFDYDARRRLQPWDVSNAESLDVQSFPTVQK